MKPTAVHRGAAFLTAAVFLFSTVAAPFVEASFWTERRRAADGLQRNPAPSNPGLLAQLPAVAPNPYAALSARVNAGLPAASRSSLAAEWLGPLLSPHGEIQSVSSAGAGRPWVVLIEDLHASAEAQENISALIRRAAGAWKGSGRPLLGVEGAWGNFDLSAHRLFGEAEDRSAVSDYLLRTGVLTGPEHAALLSESPLEMRGLEDRAFYEENIAAFKSAERDRAGFDARLRTAEQGIAAAKSALYDPALREWDDRAAAYARGGLSLGGFVGALRAVGAGARRYPMADAFSEVLALETSLDFAAVERERREAVALLAGAAGDEELKRLAAAALAFRLGEISHAVFYGELRDAGRRNGVGWERFPALDAYLRYVVLAARLDKRRLFDEIESWRADGYTRLLRTPEQRALHAVSEETSAAGKLASFSLSSAEWEKLAASRPETLPARLERFGVSLDGAAWAAEIASFRKFYEAAEKRNDALTASLARAARETGAPAALMVAGGFHTEALRARLRKAGFSCAVVRPHVTRAEGLEHFLSAFARERTPLEKIFAGDALFLRSPLALSPELPEGFAHLKSTEQRLYVSLATAKALLRALRELGVGRAARREALRGLAAKLAAEAARFPAAGATVEFRSVETTPAGGVKFTAAFGGGASVGVRTLEGEAGPGEIAAEVGNDRFGLRHAPDRLARLRDLFAADRRRTEAEAAAVWALAFRNDANATAYAELLRRGRPAEAAELFRRAVVPVGNADTYRGDRPGTVRRHIQFLKSSGWWDRHPLSDRFLWLAAHPDFWSIPEGDWEEFLSSAGLLTAADHERIPVPENGLKVRMDVATTVALPGDESLPGQRLNASHVMFVGLHDCIEVVLYSPSRRAARVRHLTVHSDPASRLAEDFAEFKRQLGGKADDVEAHLVGGWMLASRPLAVGILRALEKESVPVRTLEVANYPDRMIWDFTDNWYGDRLEAFDLARGTMHRLPRPEPHKPVWRVITALHAGTVSAWIQKLLSPGWTGAPFLDWLRGFFAERGEGSDAGLLHRLSGIAREAGADMLGSIARYAPVLTPLFHLYLQNAGLSALPDDAARRYRGILEAIEVEFEKQLKALAFRGRAAELGLAGRVRAVAAEGDGFFDDPKMFFGAAFVRAPDGQPRLYLHRRFLEALLKKDGKKKDAFVRSLVRRELAAQALIARGLPFDEAHAALVQDPPEDLVLQPPPVYSEDPNSLIDRLRRELRRVQELMARIPAGVSVFGGNRVDPEGAAYRQGVELGALMYRRGFVPRTGGGPGLMEAVLRGYVEEAERHGDKSAKVQAFKMQIATQPPNKYAREGEYAEFSHFIPRKLSLIENTRGLVVAPGGFGTLDELFDAWRADRRLVLLGTDYWKPIMDAFYAAWEDYGLLDALGAERPLVTDSLDEALDYIEASAAEGPADEFAPLIGADAEKRLEEMRRTLSEVQSLEPAVQILGSELLDESRAARELELAGEAAAWTLGHGLSVRFGGTGAVTRRVLARLGGAVGGKVQAAVLTDDGGAAARALLPEGRVLATSDPIAHKVVLTENALGYVVLPGRLGTLDLVSDLLDQMQTGQIPERPILLVGKAFWEGPKNAFVQAALGQKPQLIIPGKENLLRVVDTREELLEQLDGLRPRSYAEARDEFVADQRELLALAAEAAGPERSAWWEELAELPAQDDPAVLLDALVSDFYWTKVAALGRIWDLLAADRFPAGEALEALLADRPAAQAGEIRQWLDLLRTRGPSAARVAADIRGEEQDRLRGKLLAEGESVPFARLRKILAEVRSWGMAERELFIGGDKINGRFHRPAAGWKDVAPVRDGKGFHLAPRVGDAQHLPALLWWQTLLDALVWREKVGGVAPAEERRARVWAHLGDRAAVSAERRLWARDIEAGADPLSVAFDVSNSDLNLAEKNRFGAVIVKDGKLLGAGFNQAPHGQGSDHDHLGGDPRIDEIMPKGRRDGHLDLRDDRLDLRRSPCAEKKAVLEALASGESLDGATLYVTRAPCHHCFVFLQNTGLAGIVSPESWEEDALSDRVEAETAALGGAVRTERLPEGGERVTEARERSAETLESRFDDLLEELGAPDADHIPVEAALAAFEADGAAARLLRFYGLRKTAPVTVEAVTLDASNIDGFAEALAWLDEAQPPERRRPVSWFAETLRKNARLVGAFEEGRLVGYALGLPLEDTYELGDETPEDPNYGARNTLYAESLVVLPTHRGRGVGESLRRVQMETARSEGFRFLTAHVDPAASPANLTLHRRLGAQELHELPDYDGAGGTIVYLRHDLRLDAGSLSGFRRRERAAAAVRALFLEESSPLLQALGLPAGAVARVSLAGETPTHLRFAVSFGVEGGGEAVVDVRLFRSGVDEVVLGNETAAHRLLGPHGIAQATLFLPAGGELAALGAGQYATVGAHAGAEPFFAGEVSPARAEAAGRAAGAFWMSGFSGERGGRRLNMDPGRIVVDPASGAPVFLDPGQPEYARLAALFDFWEASLPPAIDVSGFWKGFFAGLRATLERGVVKGVAEDFAAELESLQAHLAENAGSPRVEEVFAFSEDLEKSLPQIAEAVEARRQRDRELYGTEPLEEAIAWIYADEQYAVLARLPSATVLEWIRTLAGKEKVDELEESLNQWGYIFHEMNDPDTHRALLLLVALMLEQRIDPMPFLNQSLAVMYRLWGNALSGAVLVAQGFALRGMDPHWVFVKSLLPMTRRTGGNVEAWEKVVRLHVDLARLKVNVGWTGWAQALHEGRWGDVALMAGRALLRLEVPFDQWESLAALLPPQFRPADARRAESWSEALSRRMRGAVEDSAAAWRAAGLMLEILMPRLAVPDLSAGAEAARAEIGAAFEKALAGARKPMVLRVDVRAFRGADLIEDIDRFVAAPLLPRRDGTGGADFYVHESFLEALAAAGAKERDSLVAALVARELALLDRPTAVREDPALFRAARSAIARVLYHAGRVSERWRTSLNKPNAAVRAAIAAGLLTPGTRNLDLGGGGHGANDRVFAEAGVSNFNLDPFWRGAADNAAVVSAALKNRFDSAVIANVLDTIEDPEDRRALLLAAGLLVKPSAPVVISVPLEGAWTSAEKADVGDGIVTGQRTFSHKWTVEEIVALASEFFEDVRVVEKKAKSGVVIAASRPRAFPANVRAAALERQLRQFDRSGRVSGSALDELGVTAAELAERLGASEPPAASSAESDRGAGAPVDVEVYERYDEATADRLADAFAELLAGEHESLRVPREHLRLYLDPLAAPLVVLAKSEGRVVGGILGLPLERWDASYFGFDENHGRGNTLFTQAFAVSPAFRGRGVGRQLKVRQLDEAFTRGFSHVTGLISPEVSAPSLGLSLSLGGKMAADVPPLDPSAKNAFYVRVDSDDYLAARRAWRREMQAAAGALRRAAPPELQVLFPVPEQHAGRVLAGKGRADALVAAWLAVENDAQVRSVLLEFRRLSRAGHTHPAEASALRERADSLAPARPRSAGRFLELLRHPAAAGDVLRSAAEKSPARAAGLWPLAAALAASADKALAESGLRAAAALLRAGVRPADGAFKSVAMAALRGDAWLPENFVEIYLDAFPEEVEGVREQAFANLRRELSEEHIGPIRFRAHAALEALLERREGAAEEWWNVLRGDLGSDVEWIRNSAFHFVARGLARRKADGKPVLPDDFVSRLEAELWPFLEAELPTAFEAFDQDASLESLLALVKRRPATSARAWAALLESPKFRTFKFYTPAIVETFPQAFDAALKNTRAAAAEGRTEDALKGLVRLLPSHPEILAEFEPFLLAAADAFAASGGDGERRALLPALVAAARHRPALAAVYWGRLRPLLARLMQESARAGVTRDPLNEALRVIEGLLDFADDLADLAPDIDEDLFGLLSARLAEGWTDYGLRSSLLGSLRRRPARAAALLDRLSGRPEAYGLEGVVAAALAALPAEETLRLPEALAAALGAGKIHRETALELAALGLDLGLAAEFAPEAEKIQKDGGLEGQTARIVRLLSVNRRLGRQLANNFLGAYGGEAFEDFLEQADRPLGDPALRAALARAAGAERRAFDPQSYQRLVELASGYQALGLSGLFAERTDAWLAAGGSDGRALAEDLSRRLFDKFAEALGVPAGAEASSKWHMPGLSRLFLGWTLLKDTFWGGVLTETLRAVFEDRFEAFITDENQAGELGRALAAHNRQVREAIAAAGLNVGAWLGRGRAPREIVELKAPAGVTPDQALDRFNGRRRRAQALLGSAAPAFIASDWPAAEAARRIASGDFEDWLSAERERREGGDAEVSEALFHLRQDYDALVEALRAGPPDVSKVGKKLVVKLWDRRPGFDLFQGNFVECCVAIGGRMFDREIVSFLVDQGVQVVDVVDPATGLPVALAWVHLSPAGKDKAPHMVIDTLELKAEYAQHEREIRDALFDYVSDWARAVGARGVLVADDPDIPQKMEVGDLPNRRRLSLEKLGGFFGGSAYYLESLGSHWFRDVWSAGETDLSVDEREFGLSLTEEQFAALRKRLAGDYEKTLLQENRYFHALGTTRQVRLRREQSAAASDDGWRRTAGEGRVVLTFKRKLGVERDITVRREYEQEVPPEVFDEAAETRVLSVGRRGVSGTSPAKALVRAIGSPKPKLREARGFTRNVRHVHRRALPDGTFYELELDRTLHFVREFGGFVYAGEEFLVEAEIDESRQAAVEADIRALFGELGIAWRPVGRGKFTVLNERVRDHRPRAPPAAGNEVRLENAREKGPAIVLRLRAREPDGSLLYDVFGGAESAGTLHFDPPASGGTLTLRSLIVTPAFRGRGVSATVAHWLAGLAREKDAVFRARVEARPFFGLLAPLLRKRRLRLESAASTAWRKFSFEAAVKWFSAGRQVWIEGRLRGSVPQEEPPAAAAPAPKGPLVLPRELAGMIERLPDWGEEDAERLARVWAEMEFYRDFKFSAEGLLFLRELVRKLKTFEPKERYEAFRWLKPWLKTIDEEGFRDWHRTFMRIHDAYLPPRPPHEAFAWETALADADVLLVGNAHTFLSQQAFLASTMKQLKAAGATHVALEGMFERGVRPGVAPRGGRRFTSDMIRRAAEEAGLQVAAVDISFGALERLLKARVPAAREARGFSFREFHRLVYSVGHEFVVALRHRVFLKRLLRIRREDPKARIAFIVGSMHVGLPLPVKEFGDELGRALHLRVELEKTGLKVREVRLVADETASVAGWYEEENGGQILVPTDMEAWAGEILENHAAALEDWRGGLTHETLTGRPAPPPPAAADGRLAARTSEGPLRLETERFPDGELKHVNPDHALVAGREVFVRAEPRSADDLVELLLALDNFRRDGARRVSLSIAGEWREEPLLLRLLAGFADEVRAEGAAGPVAEPFAPVARAEGRAPVDFVLAIDERLEKSAREAAAAAGAAYGRVAFEAGFSPKGLSLPEGVAGRHVVLIHSTENGGNLARLLVALAALREAGVSEISVINTYEGYARQDKRFRPGEAVSAVTMLRAVNRLAGRRFALNAHYGGKSGLTGLEGEMLHNVNAFPQLAEHLFNYALKRLFGTDPAKLDAAGRRALADRIREEFEKHPLVLAAPDDGAFPYVAEAAETLRHRIKWDYGVELPVHAAYLSKERRSATSVVMRGPLLTAGDAPLALPDDVLKEAWAFVLDDETAQGSTLLSAVYVLVRELGLAWPRVYTAVVQGKFNRGLEPFETGLLPDALDRASGPATEKVDVQRRRMAPRFVAASESLPMPPDVDAERIVSVRALITYVVRRLIAGDTSAAAPPAPPVGGARAQAAVRAVEWIRAAGLDVAPEDVSWTSSPEPNADEAFGMAYADRPDGGIAVRVFGPLPPGDPARVLFVGLWRQVLRRSGLNPLAVERLGLTAQAALDPAVGIEEINARGQKGLAYRVYHEAQSLSKDAEIVFRRLLWEVGKDGVLFLRYPEKHAKVFEAVAAGTLSVDEALASFNMARRPDLLEHLRPLLEVLRGTGVRLKFEPAYSEEEKGLTGRVFVRSSRALSHFFNGRWGQAIATYQLYVEDYGRLLRLRNDSMTAAALAYVDANPGRRVRVIAGYQNTLHSMNFARALRSRGWPVPRDFYTGTEKGFMHHQALRRLVMFGRGLESGRLADPRRRLEALSAGILSEGLLISFLSAEYPLERDRIVNAVVSRISPEESAELSRHFGAQPGTMREKVGGMMEWLAAHGKIRPEERRYFRSFGPAPGGAFRPSAEWKAFAGWSAAALLATAAAFLPGLLIGNWADPAARLALLAGAAPVLYFAAAGAKFFLRAALAAAFRGLLFLYRAAGVPLAPDARVFSFLESELRARGAERVEPLGPSGRGAPLAVTAGDAVALSPELSLRTGRPVLDAAIRALLAALWPVVRDHEARRLAGDGDRDVYFRRPFSRASSAARRAAAPEEALAKLAAGGDLTRAEARRLADWTLGDPLQKNVFGLSRANAEEELARRADLFRRTAAKFEDSMRSQGIDDMGLAMLWRVYVPLALWLRDRKAALRPDEAYVVGFSGGIGAGKTTRTRILSMLLDELLGGERTVVISIDDFYKTRAERLPLREKGYGRRGPPGTHDVALAVETLRKLRRTDAGSVVELPVFSKEIDDRLPEPAAARGKVGVVFLEGWLVGAPTDADPALVEPGFKRAVAEAFREYGALNAELDDLIVRNLHGLDDIKWMYRDQVERQRARHEAAGKVWTGLEDHEIEPFVESLYVAPWDAPHTSPMPREEDSSIVVMTDRRRRIVSMTLGGRARGGTGAGGTGGFAGGLFGRVAAPFLRRLKGDGWRSGRLAGWIEKSAGAADPRFLRRADAAWLEALPELDLGVRFLGAEQARPNVSGAAVSRNLLRLAALFDGRAVPDIGLDAALENAAFARADELPSLLARAEAAARRDAAAGGALLSRARGAAYAAAEDVFVAALARLNGLSRSLGGDVPSDAAALAAALNAARRAAGRPALTERDLRRVESVYRRGWLAGRWAWERAGTRPFAAWEDALSGDGAFDAASRPADVYDVTGALAPRPDEASTQLLKRLGERLEAAAALNDRAERARALASLHLRWLEDGGARSAASVAADLAGRFRALGLNEAAALVPALAARGRGEAGPRLDTRRTWREVGAGRPDVLVRIVTDRVDRWSALSEREKLRVAFLEVLKDGFRLVRPLDELERSFREIEILKIQA